MRRYIQDLQPTNIADLCAMVALYRPGPMQHIPRFIDGKHGDIEITYPHPDLAEVLDETYGVIVYQDQVLLIARQFAGYTLGQADIMRKAMGKKKAEIMQAERRRFLAGALAKGYTEEEADDRLRPHRALRRLRLQQGPCLVLRQHRLPDRLPQGQLPRPVHDRRPPPHPQLA